MYEYYNGALDLNDVRYRLALIYAKEKLVHEMNHGETADDMLPAFLLDKFGYAYGEYAQLSDDSIKKTIDLTGELDG